MKALRGLAIALAAFIATAAAAQPAKTSAVAPQAYAAADAAAKASTTPGAVLSPADLEAWLDGAVPYALKRADAAGAVVAVVKEGRPLLVKGYGYADVAAARPMTGDRSVIRPGSITKLFTWTAVMQLVAEGKLDLDRDINSYLDFRIPPRADGPITLRHLMTHTGGFEETLKGLLFRDPSRSHALGETVKRWTPERAYPAGSTPAYSNYGAALAGYIVERVSGQPFDTYVEQHIFRPLGMAHSSLQQPLPPTLRPLAAKGYRLASRPPEAYELISMPPAGALASTGDDMARFMIAHLEAELAAGPLLAPETARLMHRPQGPGVGPLNRMTLGFFESDLNGHRAISHGGDTQWFHSELILFLDDGVGLFFGMNSAGKADAAIQVRTALVQAFADRYLPGPRPTGQMDPATARAHAAQMAGVYDNSRRSHSNFMSLLGFLGQTKVSANPDGTLTVPGMLGLDGEPRRWREIAPYVWRDVSGPWRLAAELRAGRVTRFSMDQISPIMVLEPAPWWRSGAWLGPTLLASLAVLVLTLTAWPAAALARRGYARPFELAGADAWAYRLSRLACAGVLLVAFGWGGVIAAGLADLELLSGPLDPWISLLGLAGPAVLAAALAGVAWNAQRVWRRRRGWRGGFARLWSATLVLSVAIMGWAAAAFHLFGLNANF